MMKRLKGWRTLILNALAGLPAIWDMAVLAAASIVPVAEQYGVLSYIPDDWKPFYIAALVIMNIILRFGTSTPVGRKY